MQNVNFIINVLYEGGACALFPFSHIPQSMRSLHAAISVFALLFSFLPLPVGAAPKEAGRSFVIYCAPFLPDQVKDVLKTQVQYFAAGGTGANNQPKWGMRPGDTLRIFDGARRTQIGEALRMPAEARTPALQLKAATPVIKAFLDFLKNDVWTGSARENPLSQDENVPTLNLPLIASDEIQEKAARILLIGSPLYHDDVPAHDMRQGWLSDGYFNQDRSVTVFSIVGKKENLKDATVRFCVLDPSWGTSNKLAHQEMIKRFWSIFIRECGGNLISFSPDLPKQLEQLASDDAKPLQIEPPRNASDKTMIIRQSLIEISKHPESKKVRSGQNVELSVSAEGAGPFRFQWKKDGAPLSGATNSSLQISKATSLNNGNYSVVVTSNSGSSESMPASLLVEEDRSTTSNRQALKNDEKISTGGAHTVPEPASQGELRSVPAFMKTPPEDFNAMLAKTKQLPVKDSMRVGLIWNTADSANEVDLDLYVRPDPSAQELSFRNTKTPEGIHYKDFSDPKANHGFELVDLNVPLHPELVSVWVNAFKGQSDKGFAGELRVLYANSLKVIPIRIPATRGNQGVDGSKREGSPYWTKVQVAQSLTSTNK